MSENNSQSFFHRLKKKVERKFANPQYGKKWTKDNDWYNKIHNSNYLVHQNFIEYIKEKTDVKTVLEIGCGTGIYPIQMKNLFAEMKYTGVDISQISIDYCKENSPHKFICGDFIKMDFREKFDLVYSHAVVDHVYDIDEFISKIIRSTKKYAYINSYRGYFPDLKKHKMRWDGHDACYYNDLSIIQTRENLLKNGLKEDEFVIRAQKSGQIEKNVDLQTVIEITKNTNLD